jgi:hypothetical protein
MHSTERGELPNRFQVGAARVLVADVGAEEVPHPLLGLGLGREDGGKGSSSPRYLNFSCHHCPSIAHLFLRHGFT